MKINRLQLMLALTMSLLMVTHSQAAELGFMRYFGDGMVLQREKTVTVKGFAQAKAEITLSFAGQTKKTTADEEGNWSVALDPLPASAQGQQMTLTADKTSVKLKDVLVGDVFLIGRQSLVDLSLGKQPEGKKRASRIKQSPFRFISLKSLPSSSPQPDLAPEATKGWSVINEDSALEMDAVAFHVGAGLSKKNGVPVGIVDLAMSHYFPIAWMSREDLLNTGKVFGEDSTPVDNQVETFTARLYEYESGKVMEELKTEHAKAVELAKKRKEPVPNKPLTPPSPLTDPRFPAACYNSVLHPLRGMAFKAALLQIGNDYPYILYKKMDQENDSLNRSRLGHAWKNTYDLKKWCIYMEPYTIPRLVAQWRTYFGDHNLPFSLITPPSSDLGTLAQHHVEMRELQRRVSEDNKGVGLILPDMEHMPFSAQAKDQQVIGERSLAWIRGEVYKEDGVVSSGPLFDRVEANYSKAIVHFKPETAQGLKATPESLAMFEVAGNDAEYSPATAEVSGETIILTSESVNRIAHVRYNWKQKPDLGLTNRSGLPAIPFRSDRHVYPETITHTEMSLPEEYLIPAKDWTSGDVAIINGSLARGNWDHGDGWLGVAGIMVAPYGPNMGVLQVLAGSPADGKIFEGDVIYDVNGKLLGEKPLKDVAHALTHAESEAGEGRISFGVRRNAKNLVVELQVEVLGTYSSTMPFDCPKTDRIVANAEKFLAARGGTMKSHPVFSNCDALFLLAAGSPEYQGLVRRKVYKQMASYDYKKRIDPYAKSHIQNWHFAYNALLVSEYFLATGDRNVLPFLKWNLDYLAVTQNKVEPKETPWPSAFAGSAGGWRHNFYGNQAYGMLPTLGMPAMLSFRYAMEIGLEVDQEAVERGLSYFRRNGIEVGVVIYGHFAEPKTTPEPIDMETAEKGLLPASNGMRGMAAILFDRLGDKRTAHICSFYAANSFNNLAYAHGGHFWGNWMTGPGAYVHSKDAFIRFMKGNAWYQDLHRMFNHSRFQGNAEIGAGQFLSLVLPRHRIRMLGAPESVFQAHPKDFFRPALDAHRNRDYALAGKLAQEILDTRVLGLEEKAKAEQLVRLARELQESISLDLTKVERLIEEGKFYEASLDLPQLQGVVREDDPRLMTIVKTLTNPELEGELKKDEERYNEYLDSVAFDVSEPKPTEEDESKWTCLTPNSKVAISMPSLGLVERENANIWSFKAVESLSQAPEGWTKPNFDDSDWLKTPLPMSWYLNHQVLMRTKVSVKDKASIEALRIRMWTYRQQNVEIYINGVLVGKINQASNNPVTTALLTEGALKVLKEGENTLAVTTLNNWRWGRYMSKFESDTKNSVYNNGVSFMLDMRRKDGNR